MKLKRIAIVGLGSIGRRHLRIVNKIRPDLEVILVRSGRGNDWPEEKLATKIVHSINDAVKIGIEAAIISSPTIMHLIQAIELASAGTHMLIEKPLSHSLDGLDELHKIAIERNLVTIIGYVLRYDPGAIKFKEWLSDDCIGNLLHVRIECGSYLPDWRPEQDYRKTVSASPELGGGVLLELSHELDYLHWFFGRPLEVQARLRNSGTLGLEVEDQADLLLTGKNGVPIMIHLDFCRRHPIRECVVQTTEGELKWDAIKRQVIWKPLHSAAVLDELYFELDYIYQKQMEHYFECIEKEIDPVVTLNNGIEVMQLIDAVHRAHKDNRKIVL